MLYSLSIALMKIMFRLLGGVTCIGLENIPAEGGAILAPNHRSHMDPPAVGLYVRRPLRFMAKEELFKVPFLGAWMRGVGSFSVRRGTADRKALGRAIELLNQGELVCIFPEGTRSSDGSLREPESGIGLVALKSRAPIVPAAIVGSDKVLPPNAKRPHCHRISVAYGKPLTFPDLYDSRNSRQAYEEIGHRIMTAIADLLTTHDS